MGPSAVIGGGRDRIISIENMRRARRRRSVVLVLFLELGQRKRVVFQPLLACRTEIADSHLILYNILANCLAVECGGLPEEVGQLSRGLDALHDGVFVMITFDQHLVYEVGSCR